MSDQEKRLPLYINVLMAFLLAILLLSTILIGQTYFRGVDISIQTGKQLINEVGGKILERVHRIYDPAIALTETASALKEITSPIDHDWKHPSFNFIAASLASNPNFYALYTGYEDGSFYEVARIDDKPGMKKKINAPDQSYLGVLVIRINDKGTKSKKWTFLDKKYNKIGEFRESDVSYDPRKRPWYIAASPKDSFSKSNPYVYFHLRQPGITFSHRSQYNPKIVFAVDITLNTLSTFLAEQTFTPSSTAFLFNAKKQITGFPDPDRMIRRITNPKTGRDKLVLSHIEELHEPTLTTFHQKLGHEKKAKSTLFRVNQRDYVAASLPLPERYGQGETLGLIAPVDEFIGPMFNLGIDNAIISLILVLLSLPVMWLISRRISAPLVHLVKQTDKIKEFKLTDIQTVHSHILEVNRLARSFTSMAKALHDHKLDLLESQDRLKSLVDIGISLSREKDIPTLLEAILNHGKHLCHADAGTLYLRTDNNELRFEIMRTDSLGLKLGGKDGAAISFQPLPLQDPETNKPNTQYVATYSAFTGSTINIPDAYDTDNFDFPGTYKFDSQTGYHSKSFLTVPLKTRQGKVIGVIQLINAQDEEKGEVIAFGQDRVTLMEALAAQAAVALENQLLIAKQKELFESFVQLIATAIDAKSPYTAGHCSRVPEVTKMLAQAACDEKDGPFKDFSLDEQEMYELHLAAWLHDCGKVTTPEYVVDKATKLEMINNRIHEVRTRFEVLLRDAEINLLKGIQKGIETEEHLEQEFQQTRQRLQEEFAFIAECNIGGEFLDNEKAARIQSIANQTWIRNFDDSLGLSHIESQRYHQSSSITPPATEKLLDDKPWHVIKRLQPRNSKQFEKLGIRMEIPENLYNYGEILNLCIKRGTLTEEERYKINEHSIQTIRMLESLPFPDGLTNTPSLAGAHHETMIGTGYPRKLTKDQMSIPARIMAIADIFEALTASDRPYKKAKKLSDAIRIMNFMRKDQHIDSELFELFLKAGIHQHYADEYLGPEQIDQVDISQYLT
ncbi:HD domain-containing phosphohydrolase [Magnetococcales bacterium HHB-1]